MVVCTTIYGDTGRAFQKTSSHINIDLEFGKNEGQLSLKKDKRLAEERKPRDKVTSKMMQAYIEKTYVKSTRRISSKLSVIWDFLCTMRRTPLKNWNTLALILLREW